MKVVGSHGRELSPRALSTSWMSSLMRQPREELMRQHRRSASGIFRCDAWFLRLDGWWNLHLFGIKEGLCLDRFYFFIFCCCSVCACGGGCGGGGGHPCGEKVYRSLFGAVGTHIFLVREVSLKQSPFVLHKKSMSSRDKGNPQNMGCPPSQ